MRPGHPGRLAMAGLVCLLGGWLAAPAAGQLTPVIGRGATAFDPEISVVNSGVVADAQAVVSHDRRYVTITMGASQANLIALRPFPVQATAGAGFVGGANPPGNAPVDGDRPPAQLPGGDDARGYDAREFPIQINPTPADLNDPKLLNRRGMIRLSNR